MKNNKNIIIIFVISFILLAFGVTYGKYKLMPVKKLSENTEKPKMELPLEMNFSRTGTILNWDTESETYSKDWILLYEDPGNPAKSIGLVFDEESVCNLAKENMPCNKDLLNNGDSAMIEGHKQDNQLTVIKLQKLN